MTVKEFKTKMYDDCEKVSNLPQDASQDNNEIMYGDLAYCPNTVAIKWYDTEDIRKVIHSFGFEGTDEEVEEVLASCDLDNMIEEMLNHCMLEAVSNACLDVLLDHD